jgi:hypothetical protein
MKISFTLKASIADLHIASFNLLLLLLLKEQYFSAKACSNVK